MQGLGSSYVDAVLSPPPLVTWLRVALGFRKGLQKPMRAQGGARAGARIHT